MASLNTVSLIGYIGADPQTIETSTKRAMVRLSLATSSKWKDRDGEVHELTTWHQITAFDRMAEVIQRYVKKGASLFVQGELRNSRWEDKEGGERFSTDIVARKIEFLDRQARTGAPVEALEEEEAEIPF